MIPVELAILTNLSLLILAAAFWLRSRIVWQRRVSMIESFALSQVLGRMSSDNHHIAQIAALKRQHREEITAYRSMTTALRREANASTPVEPAAPSPRTPLPPGGGHE